jgi:hypothetical protein
MRHSYAVTWQQSGGPPHSGKLELGATGVSLEGQNGAGQVSLLIPYADLVDVKVASRPERLAGRPTLLLDRLGAKAIRIATVGSAGIILEVAEQLASMRTGHAISSERVAVVVTLGEGKRDDAEQMLVKGPPFDPELAGLERHEVFLSDGEAIFLFEAVSEFSLQKLLTDARVWIAAAGWHDIAAGPPRLAKAFYAWETAPSPDDVFFTPTPGPGDSDGGDIFPP